MSRKLREEARKHLLPGLLEQHDHKCYWCKEPIILRRSVPKNVIIEEKHGVISYYEGGVPRIVLLASVDHVNPISQGGSNVRNLVPACWFCNNERTNRIKFLNATFTY